MKKIKKIISYIKSYYYVLSDFSSLNKYIFYSSIFFNRIEKVLYSDLSNEVILDNIKLSYSDFKSSYVDDFFKEGIEVTNNFDEEVRYDGSV